MSNPEACGSQNPQGLPAFRGADAMSLAHLHKSYQILENAC